jgi:hypothetical protein
LSNKINPTESINELIWTALTFSRPFGTCAEFFRSLFSRAVKSIAVAAEVRFFPSEIAGEIEKQCTSGAKALKNAGQGGTAEAVPFRGVSFVRNLFSPASIYHTAEVAAKNPDL